MKKLLSLMLSASIVFSLSGCTNYERTATRFILDTVVTIKAQADDSTVNGALDLCAKYDKLFSRTDENSDVYKINNSDTPIEVNSETASLIKTSLSYCELSNGAFDITVANVSKLWDFTGDKLPDANSITDALKYVNYKNVKVDGNLVFADNCEIDLGAIAKGYICDRVRDYFIENGVKNAVINLGGNVTVMGSYKTVGIVKPFTEKTAVKVRAPDKTYVTSGIYQRYIEKDGEIYHHILDTKTGYGVKNSLASVTVIGNSSTDADALSTVCMLVGIERAKDIIEQTENTEAVFIDRENSITATSGLKLNGDTYTFN